MMLEVTEFIYSAFLDSFPSMNGVLLATTELAKIANHDIFLLTGTAYTVLLLLHSEKRPCYQGGVGQWRSRNQYSSCGSRYKWLLPMPQALWHQHFHPPYPLASPVQRGFRALAFSCDPAKLLYILDELELSWVPSFLLHVVSIICSVMNNEANGVRQEYVRYE